MTHRSSNDYTFLYLSQYDHKREGMSSNVNKCKDTGKRIMPYELINCFIAFLSFRVIQKDVSLL